MNRAASTDENKQYIEERVQEIGGKRGLEGLTTEWEEMGRSAGQGNGYFQPKSI